MVNRSTLLLVVTLSILLSSCSSKFSLTKRRYFRGYYFDVAKKASSKKGTTNRDKPVAIKVKPQIKQVKVNPETNNEAATTAAVSTKENFRYERAISTGQKNSIRQKIIKKIQELRKKVPKKTAVLSMAKASRNQWKQKTQSRDPYVYGFGNGMGSIFLIIGGIILSFILSFLFFLLIAALVSGDIPAWVFGLILLIAAVVIITIIVLVVINGD